eukprot:SAG31_NODE_1000_length_10456_cov_3.588394_5_plen_973_part_00
MGGCSVLVEKPDPKQEDDEFGWQKSAGGYPKWKGSNSGPSIMELVNEVYPPAVQIKLEQSTGEMQTILNALVEAVHSSTETFFLSPQGKKAMATAAAGNESISPTSIDTSVVPEKEEFVDEADQVLAMASATANAEMATLNESTVTVPAGEFLKRGLLLAFETLQPVLIDLGGAVADRAASFDLSVEERSTDMRRKVDQLLQELVLNAAQKNVYPLIDDLMSKNRQLRGPLAKKVKLMVYDIAEATLRKRVHVQVHEAYDDLLSQSVPDGMGLRSEDGDEREEDEYGFLVCEGGYKAFKGNSGFGGLVDPMALVRKVLSDEVVFQLHSQVDQMHTMVQSYSEHCLEVKEAWLVESGADEIEAAGGLSSNNKKLKNIHVPATDFQKAGLVHLMAKLIPVLESVGTIDERIEQLQPIVEDLQSRSTDMRRALDQMLQEYVMAKVKDHVFPFLKEKLANVDPPGATPLPPNVVSKLSQIIYDEAESLVRKEVHSRFTSAFTAVSEASVPTGCGVVKEAGKAKDEDEYGFLTSEGGYKKFKGNSGFGGLVDPMALAELVMDSEASKQLKAQIETAQNLIEKYTVQTDSLKREWLAAGAQAKLDKAGRDEKKLAKITVPIHEFQKGGLTMAANELLPVLANIGLAMRERLEDISFDDQMRSTDLRRGFDLLLQEFVVDKAKRHVFPYLQEKVSDLSSVVKLPPMMPAIPEKILEKVAQLVFNAAEAEVRREMHNHIVSAYSSVSDKLIQPGCTMAVEAGEALEEDEYGFLTSEGGYNAFKNADSFKLPGGLDPMTIVEKLIDSEMIVELKSQADEAEQVIRSFQNNVVDAKNVWLSQHPDGVVASKLIEKGSKGASKKLQQIEVPTSEFVKEGLMAAMEKLRPQLQSLGLAMKERVDDIPFESSMRSTDLRRGLDQLLQELVLINAKERIFPELRRRIRTVKIPMPFPGMVAPPTVLQMLAGFVLEKVSPFALNHVS